MKKMVKTDKNNLNGKKKNNAGKIPTIKLKTDRDIAEDFSVKVYQKFDKMIKAIVLFGSQIKHTNIPGSDIDLIFIIDDATIKFDDKLIVWYRDELKKLVEKNPYKKDLHINTVRLTTWWNDLLKGDPIVINMIRYGEAIIDVAGFFNPLKMLLQEGKIKPTPEAIYTALNRVPEHISRSKIAEISAIEGCYWAMVDSSQALLMSIKITPPSPEHIGLLLKKHFVDKKLLKLNDVNLYQEIYELHKNIIHGKIHDLDGKLIDGYQKKVEDFFKKALKLVKETLID